MSPALRCAVLRAAWGTRHRGEVFGLQRRDVDTERGTDHVHVRRSATELRNGELVIGPPKTSAGTRVVHLPGPVVDALAEHLERYCGPDPEDPVFPAEGNKVLRPRTFTTLWTDARRRTGPLRVRFHDPRHVAGYELRHRGQHPGAHGHRARKRAQGTPRRTPVIGSPR